MGTLALEAAGLEDCRALGGADAEVSVECAHLQVLVLDHVEVLREDDVQALFISIKVT